MCHLLPEISFFHICFITWSATGISKIWCAECEVNKKLKILEIILHGIYPVETTATYQSTSDNLTPQGSTFMVPVVFSPGAHRKPLWRSARKDRFRIRSFGMNDHSPIPLFLGWKIWRYVIFSVGGM